MAFSILPSSCAIALVLLYLSPVATFAAAVFDTNGEPLTTKEAYYILPRGLHGIGGLTAVTPVNESSPCPLSITPQPYALGSSIMITNIESTEVSAITTGLHVSPYFNDINTGCSNELRWWVTNPDADNNRFVIVGVETHGSFVTSYYFKIVEADDNKGKYVYNIKFCHMSGSITFNTISNTAQIDEDCSDVNFVNGVLGLIPNKPFDVVFIKNVGEQEFAA